MKRFAPGPRFWFIASAVLALALDQFSKLLVLQSLALHVPHKVLGDFLRFSLTLNDRGLFGMSYGPIWMHYLLPVIVVIGVIYLGIKSPDRWFAIALGMILGGGAGNNLIDRVRLGAVVDFIDMGIGSARWYTYNLADAFAVAGVIMLLAHEFLGWGKARTPAGSSMSAPTPAAPGQS